MIVPLDATSAGEAFEQVRAIRVGGDVPLVMDARWPAAHRDVILRTARAAALHPDTAWASATSGSSGTPRIVVRTDESWRASFATVGRLLDAGVSDNVLLPAPSSSSLTLFSLAHALAGGPQPATTDEVGPTCVHGTPQSLRAMLDEGAPVTMRRALIGGSHVEPQLRARAEEQGIHVTSYYGAAELSFVAIDEGDGLRPFNDVEVRIIDDELWVRSPFIAQGYLAESGSGALRRDGEWATVGDRAEIVGDALRLLGRSDDAILSASATIVPEEVEAVLRSVAGVNDAVVFGWPRPGIGALVAAIIEGDEPDLAQLRAACERMLVPAHRPRLWFTATLPRTPSGKPARAAAAQMAIAGQVTKLDVSH